MKVANAIRRWVQGPGLAQGTRSAVVVAVAAHKGGVGKTTTAVHLAEGLARFHDQRTLLVDMDAQGHCGLSLRRTALRPDAPDALGKVLLERRRDIQEIVEPTEIENLWTVPSDPHLGETEKLMASRIGRELRLRQALAIARTHFDVIVIDTPPNAGGLTVSALVAADAVLVPCELALLSVDGVGAVLETVAEVQDTLNPALDLVGVLRTRVDRRKTRVNAPVEAELEARFGATLLATAIGASTDVAKAQAECRSVFALAPQGRAAEAYGAAVAEVADRILDVAKPQARAA